MPHKGRFFDHRDPAKDEQRSVPFLRPFEWVATALTSFREKPLPSAYTPTAQPTFDLFGTSRLPELEVERIFGGADQLEVFGSKVPADKWRQYLSVAVSHDDAISRIFTFSRVVQDNVLGFPAIPFAASLVLAKNLVFAERNISVPPDGRISAKITTLTLGSEMFLQTLFIEYDLGEPSGGVS